MSFETEEVNVILEPIFKESELAEPVAEPVVETVVETVAEQVVEQITESVTEPVAEKQVDVFEDNVIKNAKIIYTQTNMLSSIIDNTKKGHHMKNYKRPIPLLYKN